VKNRLDLPAWARRFPVFPHDFTFVSNSALAKAAAAGSILDAYRLKQFSWFPFAQAGHCCNTPLKVVEDNHPIDEPALER